MSTAVRRTRSTPPILISRRSTGRSGLAGAKEASVPDFLDKLQQRYEQQDLSWIDVVAFLYRRQTELFFGAFGVLALWGLGGCA
jgi:hypothetical protein